MRYRVRGRDERDDPLAAREYAADDLAADAAGGADHRRRHRVSLATVARGVVSADDSSHADPAIERAHASYPA